MRAEEEWQLWVEYETRRQEELQSREQGEDAELLRLARGGGVGKEQVAKEQVDQGHKMQSKRLGQEHRVQQKPVGLEHKV
eukprot:CAMPEP_0117851450 /NCGR_PEP_ID=MMETSP0949-20121206/22396_1 /TAXON_ID=44440 /ORGANISM="Chattonella subsalsa, Strain CCMP2191" /LENGTH=79 /DNA_ID=CAMNT_0005699249 /DNA_START=1 /DNA_END=241 /DNA_ORIENTATION=-